MKNPSAQKDFGDVVMNDAMVWQKTWVKAHINVNDFKKGILNSPSIILFTAFHL
jgi:hypothetical protein